MLLSQQARLVRIDSQRAVVQVSGNWMGMVQSRAALLEKAIARAMGGNRQLVLENHGGAAPMAAMPGTPTPTPASTPAPATTSGAQLPSRPESAAAPTPSTTPARPQPISSTPPVSADPKTASQAEPASASAPSTAASPVRSEPSAMDEKVKRFADFFNGQVLDVDLNNQIPGSEA